MFWIILCILCPTLIVAGIILLHHVRFYIRALYINAQRKGWRHVQGFLLWYAIACVFFGVVSIQQVINMALFFMFTWYRERQLTQSAFMTNVFPYVYPYWVQIPACGASVTYLLALFSRIQTLDPLKYGTGFLNFIRLPYVWIPLLSAAVVSIVSIAVLTIPLVTSSIPLGHWTQGAAWSALTSVWGGMMLLEVYWSFRLYRQCFSDDVQLHRMTTFTSDFDSSDPVETINVQVVQKKKKIYRRIRWLLVLNCISIVVMVALNTCSLVVMQDISSIGRLLVLSIGFCMIGVSWSISMQFSREFIDVKLVHARVVTA